MLPTDGNIPERMAQYLLIKLVSVVNSLCFIVLYLLIICKAALHLLDNSSLLDESIFMSSAIVSSGSSLMSSTWSFTDNNAL